MSIETTVAELDKTIADNSRAVDLYKALQRLESNRDFKKLIGEGYFKDEAIRLVHAKSDASMQTPERQASILTQMDSIGNLASYFNSVRQQGETATKVVEDAEIDRTAILRGY